MFLDSLSDVNELYIYPGGFTSSFIEVTVTAPRIGFSNTVFLEPGVESVSVQLPQGLQAGSGSGRYNGGVMVTASSDIRVMVAQHFNGQPIASYTAYPVDALGNTYYASTFYPEGYHFNIGIVAAATRTTVRVSLPENNQGMLVVYNGVAYTDGQEIQIQLEEMESLQIVDTNNANLEKALLIQADQPIAVFVANKDVPPNEEAQGARDTMTTQIPPLHAIGTTYHIPQAPGRSIEETYVLQAVRDGTVITVSGQSGVTVLDQAQMTSYTITSATNVQ
jgi:hypothetical protein